MRGRHGLFSRVWRWLPAVLLVAFAGAACGDGDSDATPSPTEGPGEATATVTMPVRPSVTPVAGSSPVAGMPQPYVAGTRTGNAGVDAVLAALEMDSPQVLRSLMVEVPAPCVVNPQGITNPPLCPAGVQAGTLVPVFRATACEGVWPPELEDRLSRGLPQRVLAVYRDAPEAYQWLPAADFVVLTIGKAPFDGWPASVRVKDGKVNGIAFGCGQPFPVVVAEVGPGQYLLPPKP